VDPNLQPCLCQLVDQGNRRAFAQVIRAGLEGEAQNPDPWLAKREDLPDRSRHVL
jgi:hypothetical protein